MELAAREFTLAAGQSVPDHPVEMTPEAVTFICKMMIDEMLELMATTYHSKESKEKLVMMVVEAKECVCKAETKTEKIAEQADALVDQLYYLLNCAAKHGINVKPVFDAVHGANMNKVDPQSGKFIIKDGKIQKPPGWVAPDITSIIQLQLIDGSWIS